MRFAHVHVLWGLLPLLHAVPALAQSSISKLQDDPQAAYAQAIGAMQERRWASAYGRFAKLADGGHLPSAEMAQWMHRFGPELFGSRWSATPDQQQRWKAMVVNQARNRVAVDDLANAE